jgi:hypothetical protein
MGHQSSPPLACGHPVTSIPAFCIAAAIGVKEISGWLAGQPVGADDVIDRP